MAVGATGNPLVELQYHTPSKGSDTPTGVVLQRFDSAGTSLGDVGPAPSSGWAPPLSTLEAFADDHFVLTARFVQNMQETQLIETGAFTASSVIPSPSGGNALLSATGDDAGDVYASYRTNGNITFPLGGAQSTPYIVKADKTQATLWTKPLLGRAELHADGGGGLYVAGSGPPPSADPGCGVLDPSQGYVGRFDGAGSCLWRRTIDFESGAITSYDIEAGGPDAAYLGGTFQGTTDLGCGPVTSAAGEHVLVALDETGAFAWQKAPFDGRFALDPCGAVIAAEACGTCGPNAAAGVTVAKLAP